MGLRIDTLYNCATFLKVNSYALQHILTHLCAMITFDSAITFLKTLINRLAGAKRYPGSGRRGTNGCQEGNRNGTRQPIVGRRVGKITFWIETFHNITLPCVA